MATVLIIDDDNDVCQSITNVVDHLGHQAFSAVSLNDGMNLLQSRSFDIVLLDVRLPDGNGLEILPDISQSTSSPEVIIITGYGDPDGAELAIKNGAWDYIQKPFSLKTITLLLKRTLDYRNKKKESQQPVLLKRDNIIGNSLPIQTCLQGVAQAAHSDANVLITGETGSGKELIASAIHDNSQRAKRSFVVVDCASLPETLVGSVLFGHEKGSFTGADKYQCGLIKQADGGTLFLDEVGELPLSIQKSFLRVLQEKKFRPVGSKREQFSDFRLVAATNRNLDHEVDSGSFREDLLFRLRALQIKVPPLRDCYDDLKKLVIHYTSQMCDQYGYDMKGFSPDFWKVLMQYDWPGNVRELIQALEQSLATAQNEPMLFPAHLPPYIRIEVARESVNIDASPKSTPILDSPVPAGDGPNVPTLKEVRTKAIQRVETSYLENLIGKVNGDIQKAIRLAGLSRSRFYTLVKKYKINTRM